jgi:quercetin dioxygenase-like cupin family protein
MRTADVQKSTIHFLTEIIDYVPNSVTTKTILGKITGNISVIAVDTGVTLTEKISPFDTYFHIIEGQAEIMIDKKVNILKPGQAIIIPAHASNTVKASKRCKMISTVIKSGYEAGIL